MCGIVGVFSRRGRVSAAVLERATKSLYHRGPDGQRQWISADGWWDLGTRGSALSISQPGISRLQAKMSARIIVNGVDTFNTFVQDMLRGPVLKSMPFFDPKNVVALLDDLPNMDAGARTANDQILMLLMSMCVLQERYGLAA